MNEGASRSIPHLTCEAMRREFDTYFAKLVGIKYREEVHLLQEPEPRRRGAAAALGVQMCFDTGSVTTSLTGETFDLVLKIVSSVHTFVASYQALQPFEP